MTPKHIWEYCQCCMTRMVVCGYCGNTCCNAGSGSRVDGIYIPCLDTCSSAYELQSHPELDPDPNDKRFKLTAEMKLFGGLVKETIPQGFALELERLMIPSGSWNHVPMEIENEALIAGAEGIPTGLAFHENRWFMIQSGQGPYIAKIWKSKHHGGDLSPGSQALEMWEEVEFENR